MSFYVYKEHKSLSLSLSLFLSSSDPLYRLEWYITLGQPPTPHLQPSHYLQDIKVKMSSICCSSHWRCHSWTQSGSEWHQMVKNGLFKISFYRTKSTETDLRMSHICTIWGQSDPIWMQNLTSLARTQEQTEVKGRQVNLCVTRDSSISGFITWYTGYTYWLVHWLHVLADTLTYLTCLHSRYISLNGRTHSWTGNKLVFDNRGVNLWCQVDQIGSERNKSSTY